MYEIHCEDCDVIGFHPSMTAAEARAETHVHKTGHTCSVEPMEGEYSGPRKPRAKF
jgi:hypothetical protein